MRDHVQDALETSLDDLDTQIATAMHRFAYSHNLSLEEMAECWDRIAEWAERAQGKCTETASIINYASHDPDAVASHEEDRRRRHEAIMSGSAGGGELGELDGMYPIIELSSDETCQSALQTNHIHLTGLLKAMAELGPFTDNPALLFADKTEETEGLGRSFVVIESVGTCVMSKSPDHTETFFVFYGSKKTPEDQENGCT